MKRVSIIAYVTIFILLSTFTTKGVCQISTALDTNQIRANAPAKSGLSYETLTKFFQSTITTQGGGGYAFKSTLFSTFNLFRNGRLDLSDYYNSRAGKFSRNFEYSLGLNKDKGGDFNIMTVGLKYAIVNNRDKSDHNFFRNLRDTLLAMGIVDISAQEIYKREIARSKDSTILLAALYAANDLYSDSHNFSDLPKRIQILRDSLSILRFGISETAFYKNIQKNYDNVAKQIDKKGLLTLSVNPEYHWNTKILDSTNITLHYLVGLGKNIQKAWYMDLQLSDVLKHGDITTNGPGRNMLRVYAAGNKILANDKENNPLLEMSFALENTWVTNKKLVDKEKRNNPKLDAVFRVHFSKQITIPVTLKYDLDKPNLFGFLTLQWNLENKN